MSWITLADDAAIASFLLAHTSSPAGAPHDAAPGHQRRVHLRPGRGGHRPGLLFLPEAALKLALGGVSSDILASARVMPRRLEAAGYRFRFPDLPAALAAELAAQPVPSSCASRGTGARAAPGHRRASRVLLLRHPVGGIRPGPVRARMRRAEQVTVAVPGRIVAE